MIIRTYSCLNRNCRHEFDSDGDFPPCPHCRGLRVQWVPRPVAIRSSAMASIDATARQLAADYGLTNFHSPEFGQPAVRKSVQPQLQKNIERGPNSYEPAPGWRIDLPASALTGKGHAVCAPTGVTAKVKVDPNVGALREVDANTGMAAMRANTRIEGTHRPTKS